MEEADELSASQEPIGQREDCKSCSIGELEDELDIYKDIECTSPVGGNKEPQSVSNLLPPPPEPPRMLVDFGKSDLSVEMDDSVIADICRKGSDDSDCGVPCALNSPILESEIYDPAEPCMDSDDEIPVKPVYKALEEDIPLPPGSPVGKLEESRTNVVSYSSTDSSGCESESGVKLKLGVYETRETSCQPTRELVGEEGGLWQLRPQTPTSPKCQTVSEEVLGIKIGENFLRHPDARLSDTIDDEQLQKADESRVTSELSITDNLGKQSKSCVEICKVCSKSSEGDSELLGVCNCESESNSVRKRKGTGVNASSTSSSLESSSCSSSSSSNNSICSSSSDSSDIEHSDKAVDCDDPSSGRDSGHKKKRKKKNQNLKSQEENIDTDGDFQLKSKRDKFCTDTSVMVASGKGIVAGERCNSMETDLIVSFDKSSVRNIVENSLPDPAAQLGLEGLDTESISENEAFNFDDYCSQSDNDRDSGEIDCAPLRKKRKLRNKLSGSRQSASKSDIFKELDENISVPKLDWNSEEDVGKKVFDSKEDRMMERKGKKYEKENATNDGTEVSKKNNFDKKSKKMIQTDIVSSIECKDNTISWKKISLEGKERNYRDSKMPRSGEKEKEYHSVKGMSNKKEKKMKEKRKDIERYDVRKVLNDKRKIGDRFGRDQSREYSFSRSRSRSNGLRHSRSRSASRSKARSPNRYRHRSKSRSRSRSYKSRRRLKNKTGRKSKDRSRESFSREKRRKQRSRSRNRRGSKSRSRSRSWNRSRSRSVVKSRKRQERGRNSAKSSQRMRNKRSWSRTWTPSWSRSRSGSTTSSSFSRSCSPPPRKFTRSFTHSFSRSWSREPHEHIPVPKASTLVKSSKKHSVILTKPKDEEHHVKKGKKKKDSRAEKNKKRKERLIPPSKEVFTSGDNILVSVNFNKSTRSSGLKSGDSSILSSSCLSLPSKITSKHSHLDENFEITKELTKKPKKEIISGDKILEEGTNVDNAGDAILKQKKKMKKSLKEDKRFAALLKQKPIAVIDLDHSPFKERTPSPTDLIVLSDSNEEAVNNDSKVVAENTSNPEFEKLSLDIPSPPNKTEMIHGRVSDLSITTGPKTPPEPPNERNRQAKSKLAVTAIPLRDDSVQPSEKDEFEEHSVTCPAPQENPTLMDVSVSSPGAYDPFDPTKSATPSPGGQESGVDIAMNISSISGSHHAEEGNSRLTSDTPEIPDKEVETKSSETSAECISMTNSEQGSASISLDATKDSPKTHSENKEVSLMELKLDVNVDVNNTVVNMEIDETDGLICTRLIESVDKDQSITQTPGGLETTTVTQISTECLVTSIKCNEIPVKPDLVSNNSKLQIPLASTPIKPLQQAPLLTPPRNVAFLQIPPALSTPLIHQPQLQPMLPTQPKLPLLSTPISKQPDCPVGPFNVSSNMSVDQGLFLTSTPIATSKDGSAVPNISNISAIANYLVNSLAATPQNSVLSTPLLKQLNISDTSHHTSLASIPTPPAHNGDRKQQKTQDTTEVVDMDLDSPYSPASSEGDDLFEPPPEMIKPTPCLPAVGTKLPHQSQKTSKPNRLTESNVLKPMAKPDPLHSLFSSIAKSANKPNLHTSSKTNTSLNKSKDRHAKSTRKEIHIKRAADQLEILDELPSSAVELQVKEKFLKKLNRQERVVDEVKIALKPHYTKKYITKEEYKDILRRAVPKICHNEPGEINPAKVSSLIEAYVKKYRYAKKKFGSHGGDKDKSKTVM